MKVIYFFVAKFALFCLIQVLANKEATPNVILRINIILMHKKNHNFTI